MNPKVIFFVAFVIAACSAEEAKPERYPAGLDPLLCPGYPNCDNALLHGTEKIEVLPTYHKSIVPGYKYYSYNQVSHIADEYYPASPYVIPPYRAYAPLRSYYRYAPIAPAVIPATKYAIAKDEFVAPIASVAPVAPNKVETINGSPIAPIAPFASLPGYASRLYVRGY